MNICILKVLHLLLLLYSQVINIVSGYKHNQTLDDRWLKPERIQAQQKTKVPLKFTSGRQRNNKNYLNSLSVGNNKCYSV